MSRYEFTGYEISQLEWGEEEHLLAFETDSALQAIKDCLSLDRKGDYMKVVSKGNGRVMATEFSPYATWKSWEVFEGMLRTHILSYKIQLNVEISENRAAEELVISAIETQRMSSR